jgi:hypothetical protein
MHLLWVAKRTCNQFHFSQSKHVSETVSINQSIRKISGHGLVGDIVPEFV